MRIAVCDDEAKTLEEVSAHIRIYSEQTGKSELKVFSFDSAKSLLRTVEAGKVFDIFLLDVYIGDEMGTELARNLRARGIDKPILFLTTSIEHAPESFETETLRYLIKPLNQEKLFEALDAAGNKATVWNGSSSSREGNFGSPSWSGYTATSIPSITVYGNNKMSFNLTTYGISGAIGVTYTTNNSAVTASGNTITIDGSKFSGTQSVAIYANGKHVQTITIVKG